MNAGARHITTFYCDRTQLEVTTITDHVIHEIPAQPRRLAPIQWIPVDCTARPCRHWTTEGCPLFKVAT